jgi:glutamate--cysteine ligase catalytic subunit
MVVVFDDKEKIAKLSLRQTEILAKLDAIVSNISADCPCQCVIFGLISPVC